MSSDRIPELCIAPPINRNIHMPYAIQAKFFLLMMVIALHPTVGFAQEAEDITINEQEILEDLIESTSKVAYRAGVLAQYEEITHILELEATELGTGSYYSLKYGAKSLNITGVIVALLGLSYAFNASKYSESGDLMRGIGLSIFGTASLQSRGMNESYHRKNTDQLHVLDRELLTIQINQEAKRIADSTITIAGLESTCTASRVRFESVLQNAIRTNIARKIPAFETFGDTDTKELLESGKHLYVKPFSVAAILHEQKLISIKQKKALESIVSMKNHTETKIYKYNSGTIANIKTTLEDQLGRSRTMFNLTREAAAQIENSKHNDEITAELKALEDAIAESEELLAEWNEQ